MIPSSSSTKLWEIRTFNGHTHHTWTFSIAMSNYQRVIRYQIDESKWWLSSVQPRATRLPSVNVCGMDTWEKNTSITANGQNIIPSIANSKQKNMLEMDKWINEKKNKFDWKVWKTECACRFSITIMWKSAGDEKTTRRCSRTVGEYSPTRVCMPVDKWVASLSYSSPMRFLLLSPSLVAYSSLWRKAVWERGMSWGSLILHSFRPLSGTHKVWKGGTTITY